MTSLNAEGLPELVARIVAKQEKQECQVTFTLPVGPEYFKVQDGEYGGNGVFFNQKSQTRFSLMDKSKGVIYLALTPETALKEVFQEEKVIDKSDLEVNYIAQLKAGRELVLFDEGPLAQQLGVAVGDLLGPKAVYPYTQLLAQALSPHADGIQYLSRHTGKPCIVLWSDFTDGNGCLETISVTSLSNYHHGGKSTKEILKFDLNILVM